MTVTEKSFILVQGNTGTFLIDGDLEDSLRRKMQPVLWFRAGLFCVVPVEVLQNVLESIDTIRFMEDKHRTIDWKQAFPFPDGRAATILAGFKY